jgi:hypothetical protein
MYAMTYRVGSVAFLLLAGFGLAHLAAPRWAHAAGLDLWNFPEVNEVQQREFQRQRELEDLQEQLSRQIVACEGVVSNLIDGRIAFAEAVDQMDEITRSRPGFDEVLRAVHFQGKTHRERVALFTLGRVKRALEDDPSRQAAILSKLRSE